MSEGEESQEEEDGCNDENIGSMGDYHKILSLCKPYLPDGIICMSEIQKSRDLVPQSQRVGVLVTCDTSESWLCEPPLRVDTDTHGSWSEEVEFPNLTKRACLVPYTNDARSKLANSVPYMIKEKSLSDFFSTPLCLKSKVKLPNMIFDKAEFTLPKGANFQLIDKLAKKCLLQNLIADKLMEGANALLGSTFEELDSLSSEAIKENLEVCRNMFQMCFMVNQRGRQELVSLYTANKMKLRDMVLSVHSGCPSSKNILRGTSLFTPNLFGEIPQSHRQAVTSAYSSGRANDLLLSLNTSALASLSLTPKTGKVGTGSFKPFSAKKGRYIGRNYSTSFSTPRQNFQSPDPLFSRGQATQNQRDSSSNRGKRGRSRGSRGFRK